jgi:diguanylate cyclase (GGDEF)-like protein/PAS domain S-box-containing protein
VAALSAPPRAAIRWTIIATVLFIAPIVGGAAFAIRGTLDRLATSQVQLGTTERVIELWGQFDALERERAAGRPIDERWLTDKLDRMATNGGRLTSDSDKVHVDLADTMAIRLPRIIALFHEMRNLIRDPPHDGRGALEERLRLAEARTATRRPLYIVSIDNMAEAFRLDPAIRADLGTDESHAEAAAQAADGLLARFTAPVGSSSAAHPLAIALDEAIAALNRLEEHVSAADRVHLKRRLSGLGHQLAYDLVPALLGVLAAAGFGIFVARSLWRDAEFREVRRESERLAQEARFRAVFEGATTGIIILERSGIIAETNGAFNRMLGYPEGYFVAKRLIEYTFEEDRRKTRECFAELVDGSIDSYHYEKRYLRADGSIMWAEVAVSRLPIDDREGWFSLGLVDDITERKRIESQLLYDATHDDLTGLANRSLLAAHLDDVLQRRVLESAAVVFIDLDHFKLVNDSLGHAAGDQLLCAVAERLQGFAGPADTVARFGGDEFAVLFGDLGHGADLTRRVAALQDRIAEPLTVEGRTIYTTASIGVAPLGPRYTNAEDVLRDADTAMYRAKSEGRARAEIFDQEMHEGAVRRLQLTSDLRSAAANRELAVAYQPIVRLEDGEVVAFEALVRWNHPRDGLLSPSDFIHLAEETGQIVAVGRWMMPQAFAQLARERLSRPHVRMHVNLAVQEVMQVDLADFVRALLAEFELPPASIVLEITEHAIIESSLASDVSLRALREIGVGICIDDFGVGYSSLRYLHRLPISSLKIDRSFVSGGPGQNELTSTPIVRMLLELARTLGLEVVAEGIEQPGQRESLQLLGAQYGQGFLFGQPAARVRVASLLPSATEILFAIGAGDAVVAVTHECDFPPAAATLPHLTRTLLPAEVLGDPAAIDRHVRASIHAGSSLYALDAERLETLAPDLIVTQELCAVCAVSYEIVAQAARRLRGDPRIVSLEPSSLEDVYATIVLLGELCQRQTGAAALVDRLRAREAALRARARREPAPRTLVLEWTDPPMSGGHWTPGLVELAGGVPVLAHPGANSVAIGWDAIAAADPDVIIVVPCGYGIAAAERAARALERLPAWTGLRAVRDGRAYAMDGNAYVNRPGPRLIDSAELFAAAIWSEPAPRDALIALRSAAPTRR